VASVDSVQMNSLWYKSWHFVYVASSAATNLHADYYVVEGIGSLIGPLYLYTNPETYPELTCFDNAGTSPVVSPAVDTYFNNTTSCSIILTGIENTVDVKTTSLYPNPASTEITIGAGNEPVREVRISNILGQQLPLTVGYSRQQATVDVSGLRAGVYFVKINNTAVIKFVKE
jgi:hypothetical protein